MKPTHLSAALAKKLNRLRDILRRTRGCVVAYSGGVDSSLLLAVAREVLGHRCLAVTGFSPLIARRERNAAVAWLRRRRIPYRIVWTDELASPAFRKNSPDRCYHCKLALFRKIKRLARARGYAWIAEGSNVDDREDIRPGMKAVRDLGVLSPLDQAGLRKSDIRELAAGGYRLPMAAKPASPCLASRLAFGTPIESAVLRRIERMEDFLYDQGMRIFRARYHPGLLRLELGPKELRRLNRSGLRQAVVARAQGLGFTYVTLDLQGFRTGSAHEPFRGRMRAGKKRSRLK